MRNQIFVVSSKKGSTPASLFGFTSGYEGETVFVQRVRWNLHSTVDLRKHKESLVLFDLFCLELEVTVKILVQKQFWAVAFRILEEMSFIGRVSKF